MTLSFFPNNAFPFPVPLAPALVALGLDDQTAATLSKVYLSSALTLKATCEAEYTRACTALLAASDERGYSSKELRSKLLTVAVARYLQALSKWEKEAKERAETSILQRGRKVVLESKMKDITTLSSKPSRRGVLKPRTKEETTNIIVKPIPFSTNGPPHTFPQPYPPQVRPKPVSFVTHIPLLDRGSGYKPRVASDDDLDACITALSRLSLGPLSPSSGSSRKYSKNFPKPRSRTHTTPNPKPTSQLSPSRPRLVPPTLDMSVATSHKTSPKNTPSNSSPTSTSRAQNIDIPRSNRRKASSIPYRRPTVQLYTSPEPSESPPLPRRIHRTPSLVSDHGSEASSPSTPPDFLSIPIPTPTLSRKGSFPETVPPFGSSSVRYYDREHGVDFGTDIYG